jgi:hypothetical protein
MRAFINETRMDVTCLRCGEPFNCTELDGYPPEFFEGIDVFVCCDPCVEQLSAELSRSHGTICPVPAPEDSFEACCGGIAAHFEDLALL